jgi:hypothetical protein
VGKPSDKNDKTQLLSDSQVLEVKPQPPSRPVEDKNDRSVWKGLVVGADEFSPPAPAKAKGSRWIVLLMIFLAAAGAAAYFLWPRGAVKVVPDATVVPVVAPPVDSLPQDAAPVADAAVDAAVDAAGDAAVMIDAAVPDDAAPAIDAGVRAPAKVPFKVHRPVKRPPPPKKGIVKRTH